MDQFISLLSVCVGALIAGLFMLISSRREHERNLLKINFENHRVQINEIINSSQQYYSACSNLLAAIDGVSKDKKNLGNLHDDHKVFLRKADSRYDLANADLEFCHAKILVLLGGNSLVSKELWGYDSVVSDLRNKVFRSGGIVIPEQEEMAEHTEKMSNLRSKFYISLRDVKFDKNA